MNLHPSTHRLWKLQLHDQAECIGAVVTTAFAPAEFFSPNPPPKEPYAAIASVARLGQPARRRVLLDGRAFIVWPIMEQIAQRVVPCDTVDDALTQLALAKAALQKLGWLELDLDPIGDPD